ncbi:MAG: peptidoglycan-associated lipoprotein Pal [Deltaproteobacteria bacterium]|nr:peptidoglycan-associated lipoprotein Pal [Deltaproteobacteria bacterium]
MKRNIQSFIIFCLAVTLISLGAACAKKQVEVAPVVDTSAEDEARRLAEQEAAAAKARAEQEAAAAKARAEQEAAAAKARAEAEAAARRLLEQQMSAFESEKIYFDYDRADLKPEAQATLEEKAKFLEDNPSCSVTIEGHCDERGTNEYNLALGERRADAAKKFLTSLGISSDRVTTVSYGEEKPVAVGHEESCWSQNRRDEFKLIK